MKSIYSIYKQIFRENNVPFETRIPYTTLIEAMSNHANKDIILYKGDKVFNKSFQKERKKKIEGGGIRYRFFHPEGDFYSDKLEGVFDRIEGRLVTESIKCLDFVEDTDEKYKYCEGGGCFSMRKVVKYKNKKYYV